MEPRNEGVVPIVSRLSGLLVVLFALVLAVGAAPMLAAGGWHIHTLPASHLKPGMRGYGLSDLGDGRGVQRFEVEIIGLLKSYAPKQDLILARVDNEAIARTGIIAGMSGSPIYVDEKLIGALAYGWPFSRDPICGITPIQSMLDIRKAPATPPVPIGGAATPTAAFVSAFRDGKFAAAMDALLGALHGGEPASASAMSRLPLPVSFAGPSRPGALFDKMAESAGWMLAPSGASSPAAGSQELAGPKSARLEPGSAV